MSESTSMKTGDDNERTNTKVSKMFEENKDEWTLGSNATEKEFWDYLATFFYQLSACAEFSLISSAESTRENTIEKLSSKFWPLRAPTDSSTPTSPVRDLVNRTKQIIGSTNSAWNAFNSEYARANMPFRNHVLELHAEFIQILKLPEHSVPMEAKRWTSGPMEICEHLLTWEEKSLVRISDLVDPHSSFWIFNFFIRLEQLISLVPVPISGENPNEGSDVLQDLMEKHRILANRFFWYLPGTKYHDWFRGEEKINAEATAARLAKMDEVKWITGLPNALNQLTSSYCTPNITSDHYVNAVIERVNNYLQSRK